MHIYKPTLRDVHEDSDVVDEDGLTHPNPNLVQAKTGAPEKQQGGPPGTSCPGRTCQTPRWSLVAGHASAADN